MRATTVICTYSMNFVGYLDKAVASMLEQTHDDLQIVIVVDGNRDVLERIQSTMMAKWLKKAGRKTILVIGHDINQGLSYSRNRGIEKADGDFIAFLDDDAIADPEWIDVLVKTYEETHALAAGGRIIPLWETDNHEFLPDEYLWLVGATHRGFHKGPGEVRNTFGSNISFRKEVFNKIGLFDNRLGRKGKGQLQGEETEFSLRMKATLGGGVYYNPEAIVHHHVMESRMELGALLRRSFEQGRSKKLMIDIAKEKGYDIGDDSEYLINLIGEGIPERLFCILNMKKPGKNISQLIFLVLFSLMVGLGLGMAKFYR